uniref:Uncharacterized protein n=1 Tax=Tetraselmis sp. GSL018 TaxID=582737 RepID=A0A061RYH7_9CHLO
MAKAVRRAILETVVDVIVAPDPVPAANRLYCPVTFYRYPVLLHSKYAKTGEG